MRKQVVLGIILTVCYLAQISELKITVERKQIVDAGGYIIRNVDVGSNNADDLVMTAELPSSDEIVGKVTLTINQGARNQKWGVQYYGGTSASLSPGLNKNNNITLYSPPPGSVSIVGSPMRERQYNFANCYWNEKFKIRNEETGRCLCAVEMDGEYIVDLADCEDPKATIYWTFARYG